MIDTVDERLKSWAQSVLGPIDVSLDPPAEAVDGRHVGLYLLALAESPALRTVEPAPLQISLRYLVTTWSEDIGEAHRLLGQLVFAAMDYHEFEVDLAPVPIEVWTAFGVAPRPAFQLRVPLRRERSVPPTRRVRKPLHVDVTPVTTFHGVVLGPEDVPVARARVEIPALETATRTDLRGVFAFEAVPAEPMPRRLLVRAKGKEFDIALEPSQLEEMPIVIRVDLSDYMEG